MCAFLPITAGTALRRMEVPGFRLTEAAQPAGARLGTHAHERASLSVVLRGVFDESFGAVTERCGPLSVLFKPEGQPHSNEYGRGGARCLFVEIEPARLARLRDGGFMFDRPLHVSSGALSPLAARIHAEFRGARRAAPVLIEGLLLELLVGLARREQAASNEPPAWLARAEAYVREHQREGVRLASVAAAVGVEPALVSRAFRRQHGVALGSYVRGLRLDAARAAMARSSRPLADIALEAGFYDQSHFTHAFRRWTGLTPAAFRATLRSVGADPSPRKAYKTHGSALRSFAV